MNSDLTVEWREPPGRGSSKWEFVVGQLSARPGEWAVVASGSTPDEFSWTRASLKKRGCEVTSRKNGEGLVELFARLPA